jgi:uncharacterized protein (TIGR02246 family)
MRAFGLIISGLLLALPSSMAGQTPGDAEAAIRAGSQAWAAAFNAGDAAALAALYAADAMVMAPGKEPATGKAAIEEHYRGALKEAAGAKNAIKTTEVMVGDGWAVEVGSFVSTARDGSHADHGRYMAVWKKVGGSWQLYRDMWNSSMTP